MSARGQFVSTMTALLDEDPQCALVLADIGLDRFAPAAAAHPDRVVNVGIREQAMIGVAAGLSLSGMRAVAHSYATFLVERPFEQIKLDLSHQEFEAVLVSIAGSYDASSEGRTHQSPGDVALLDTLPAWTVHVPGHPDEVDGLLRKAVASSGNIYIRLSEGSNREPARSGATIVRHGGEGAPLVIAVGPLLDAVIVATADLDVTVCHITTIRPFPDELVASVAATDVVLVEPYLTGTSTAQVARALVDHPHRLLSLGVSNPELHRFGSPEDHARAHGLDAAGIRRRLASYL
ncbi:MAG: transketolase family protein [Acidimicrobiales bacterium]